VFYPLPSDQDDVRTKPTVSLMLIFVNILIFCLPLALEVDFPGLQEVIYVNGALFPPIVANGIWYSSLISYNFLHADLWHLLGNMAGLLAFGFRVEDAMGRFAFLVFYLACGIVAGLVQVLLDPTSTVPVVGASGAVAGVMAAHLIGFWRTKLRVVFLPLWMLYIAFFPVLIFVVVWRLLPLGILQLPSVILLGMWVGTQAHLIWLESQGTQTFVAVGAHAGGFLMGLLLFGMLRAMGRAQPSRERDRKVIDPVKVSNSARALRKEREGGFGA